MFTHLILIINLTILIANYTIIPFHLSHIIVINWEGRKSPKTPKPQLITCPRGKTIPIGHFTIINSFIPTPHRTAQTIDGVWRQRRHHSWRFTKSTVFPIVEQSWKNIKMASDGKKDDGIKECVTATLAVLSYEETHHCYNGCHKRRW